MRNAWWMATSLACIAGCADMKADDLSGAEVGAASGSLRGSGSNGSRVGNAGGFADGGASGASGGSGGTGAVAAASASGLPCDVAQVLQSSCVGCHSNPPVGGAPMPLETYADLTAPARSNPSESVAALCVTRMSAASMPPPPAAPATPAQVATIQNWVTAGMPQGSCGGSSDGGAGEAAANPYNTPVQCSSGVTSFSTEGPAMRPGDACVSCHARSGGEAPLFTIAGTVYKTAHEPTNCEGANVSGASVVITDATNKTLTLPVNVAGNFYTTQSVAKPFQAKVVYGGRERAMSSAQNTGDCNSCHTETGANGAPGRIMLP